MASVNSVKVEVDILRRTINGIFDFIEKGLGVSEVDLKRDNYWSIADEALYTLKDGPPKELDVGSLKDDWEFVLSASKSADQQIPIMLVHLAPLLQALSQAVPSYTSPRDGTRSG
jgi:hypothetical protein